MQLADRARALLAEGKWRLRLSVEPSFDPPVVLGIEQGGPNNATGEPMSSRVVYRTWDRVADEDKFRSPVERLRHPRELPPTIIERTAEISEAQIASVPSPLTETRVPMPPITEPIVVLDGVGFELMIDSLPHRACYRWHSTRTSEYRALMDCFMQSWDRLAARLGDVITADRLASLR